MRLRQCARFARTPVVFGLLSFFLAHDSNSETKSGVIISPDLETNSLQLAEFAEEEETYPDSGELYSDEEYVVPEIQRDVSEIAYPARRMHKLLVDAAKAGDISKLGEYIGTGEDMTMLSLGGLDEDPIEFLKSMSGDEDGYEILAILQEVLEAGFVHLDKGTENEIYVWPYFYGIPLRDLDARQRVEMYKLLTHGDFEEMKNFGAYSFYRVGITPEGRWRFFVAGD